MHAGSNHRMARIERECVPTLQSYIFVTSNVKINEQDKSEGTRSLYVCTKFEVN